MVLLSALRRPPHERAGFTLYGAAVAAARAPYFFADLGVRDSVEGRLDLIHLHAALLVRRLRRDTDTRGPALA
ncbi:MAG: ubiquinol-cytochrome C chaperone family protein, partial [Alphaproteobacteria bacterium]